MKIFAKASMIICFLFTVAQAQVKNINAIKTGLTVKIDGNLDDAAWQNIPEMSDFITSYPEFGKVSTHKTIVKITYDNSAVYVGAYLYDSVKNIRRQLTARDVTERQDVDVFSVGLDTYQDRQNAFIFQVTSAGVQGDIRQAEASGFDRNWDAVWESKISIKNDGWVAEIKIPFSAIRFSKKNIQNWGLQFYRFIRSQNENSSWSPEDPSKSGSINKWGDWNGLQNIDPPLRLSFLPYLSGGIRISPTAKGNVTEYLKSGGMDVKYGINESFTLDMTLIPDFAQVQSDNVYLNLSPFQVYFDEYRPFFTEGTELFKKAGLFYSRRIGAEPGGASGVLYNYGNDSNYTIIKNPGITRLYNATKFSGRTKDNLGIGILNVASAPMYAKVHNIAKDADSTILTEPFTNYNIFVLDQSLKNRSSVTFTNTNVLRKGNSRNANVSGLNLSLFDKKNLYNLFLNTQYSSIWGNIEKYNGYASRIGFGKVSGTIKYRLSTGVESDKYDPNDLGFLYNNNSFNYNGNFSYNILHPTKHFLNHGYFFNLSNDYLYKPFVWTGLEVNTGAFFLFKNFWDLNFIAVSKPIWTNDYFVHRSYYTGWFLKRTPFYYAEVYGSSDSRKKLYVNWKLGAAESPLPNDPFVQYTLGFRYRFNDKFQLGTEFSGEKDKGNWGWAFQVNPDGSPVISRRDVTRTTNVISGQYNFSAKMNANIRLRHYWSILQNTDFYDLQKDGYWMDRPFINNSDFNFNAFNIDMFYTWDFLPGSKVIIAWKNALGSNVYFDPYMNSTYFKNANKLFNNPHSNEVTCKIVYYIDYLNLKKKKK